MLDDSVFQCSVGAEDCISATEFRALLVEDAQNKA